MNNDHCFVQINRNYLEALGARGIALGGERGQNIEYMLQEIDTKSSTLLEAFYTAKPIPNSIGGEAYELNEAIRGNGIKLPAGVKPATEKEVEDAFFDWVIVRFFDKLQGAIVKTTSIFDELMAHTDIDKVPLSYLIPPYQALFFQLNDLIKFNSTSLNISGVISGAYLFSRKDEENLYLEVHLIRMDHTNQQMHFAIDRKVINLSDSGGIFSAIDELATFKDSDNELEGLLNQVYEVIFKTILYMGLKDARIKQVNDRDAREQKLLNVKAKKAKKLANKVSYKFNYILIGSEEDDSFPVKTVIGSNGRVMPVHWRRGHLRNQKYGHNLESSYLVWIKPTLINQKLMSDNSDIKPKDYIIQPLKSSKGMS